MEEVDEETEDWEPKNAEVSKVSPKRAVVRGCKLTRKRLGKSLPDIGPRYPVDRVLVVDENVEGEVQHRQAHGPEQRLEHTFGTGRQPDFVIVIVIVVLLLVVIILLRPRNANRGGLLPNLFLPLLRLVEESSLLGDLQQRLL